MSERHFSNIRANLGARLDVAPPVQFSIQAGILLGHAVLIAALCSAVFVRLYQRTGRLWHVENNGIFRFSLSMVASSISGVYSILHVVTLCGYFSGAYSRVSRLTLQFLSPVLLYAIFVVSLHSLAIHRFYDPLLSPFPVHSPSLAAAWETSSHLKLREERQRSRRVNTISFLAAVSVTSAPVAVTVAIVKRWIALMTIVDDSTAYANSVEASHSRLSSLILSQYLAKELEQTSKLVTTAKIWAGIWMSTIILGLAGYLTALASYLTIIRARRNALARALSQLEMSTSLEARQAPSSPFRVSRKPLSTADEDETGQAREEARSSQYGSIWKEELE
ncbi:uncharacterized protein JCM15063_004234 [Sporobolomyces koalae]|uniref:uncharacterized protein n=1 Tax=Sporobolomyces koalae TaxID=500713 RepID=UPI0031720F36